MLFTNFSYSRNITSGKKRATCMFKRGLIGKYAITRRFINLQHITCSFSHAPSQIPLKLLTFMMLREALRRHFKAPRRTKKKPKITKRHFLSYYYFISRSSCALRTDIWRMNLEFILHFACIRYARSRHPRRSEAGNFMWFMHVAW